MRVQAYVIAAGSRRLSLLVLALGALLAIYAYARIDFTDPSTIKADRIHYTRMARAAPGFALRGGRPMCYRILGPYVVGLLPLPVDAGFLLLTEVSALLIPLFLYVLFLRLGLSNFSALSVGLFYILNKYLYGSMLWNFYRIGDGFTAVLLVLAFITMYQGRWLMFGLVLFLGALTRETALIMVPVGLVRVWEAGKLRRDGKYVLLAGLPAVGVFLGLRWAIPAQGGLGLKEALVFVVGFKAFRALSWYRTFINAFTPLSLLPLVFHRETIELFKEHKHLLAYGVLVLASTLFGVDHERLVMPGFIVFYFLIGRILDRHFEDKPKHQAVLFGAVLLAMPHHYYTVIRLPGFTYTVVMAVVTLSLATGVSILAKRGPTRSRAETVIPTGNGVP